jgi:tRNA (guanine37-N1)-methyltransferase
MILEACAWGVVGQAIKKDILSVNVVTPRDYTSDVHRTVDDRPFGGGDGMVMLYEPLKKTLESLGEKRGKVIYLSPQGRPLDDQMARELANEEKLTLVCGRYGGIDQRFLNSFVDQEISIGDYVLSGGELGALVLIDSISRFVPGVLGHVDSAHSDSFAKGHLEAPLFTRPEANEAGTVPEILKSGHHAKIEEYRESIGALVTLAKRPDLYNWPAKDSLKLLEVLKGLSSEELSVLGLDQSKVSIIEHLEKSVKANSPLIK